MSIEIINKLKPVIFKYNDIIPELKDDKIHMGFMAQDLQELFGKNYAIVSKNKDTDYLMVQYHELIAPLTKAIQELSKKVEDLEKKLNNNLGD